MSLFSWNSSSYNAHFYPHQPFLFRKTMNKSVLLYLRLLFWVLVPIVLLVLPKTFFNEGIPLCPSMIFLGMECPGCGLTRACMHLIHLDFEEAFAFNMLSFVVFPILAFWWAKWFWTDWKQFRALKK